MADNTPSLKSGKWAKKLTIPLPRWHAFQASTNDCGPFSATMVTNALRNRQVFDAPTLARRLEEAPQFSNRIVPSRVSGSATFPWGILRALRSVDLEARWRMGATIDRLKRNLEKNIPTIVIVGDPWEFNDKGKYIGWSHYKILYAWDEELGFAFVDPAARENKVFSYQTEDSFEEEWGWMGRQAIEVWDELAQGANK